MTQRLICITGLDGTGKSTLIEALKNRLNSPYHATIWDLLKDPVKGLPFSSKEQIDNFLCGLTPDSRLLFLAHAMKYSVDKALQSDTELIILDSYTYKYFATEIALGANPKLATMLESIFPAPDTIIELVLPVEEAVKRKKSFSRYECGICENPNALLFLNFQKKVVKIWKEYDRANWKPVNAGKPPDEVLNLTLKNLL